MTRQPGTCSQPELSFRSLFESAPDAMVLADERGRIVMVSNQTLQLFGYTREEVVGNQVEILMPERFREGRSIGRSAFTTEPRRRSIDTSLELFGLRKDGGEFPIEISLSPVESEDGLLVWAAIRDISERNRLEHLRAELGFEKLLNQISAGFINLPSDQVDGEIENGLRHVVEWFGTDRAAISEADIATGIIRVTHRWDRPGITPSSAKTVKESFPWVFDRLIKGETVSLSRPDDLPEEAGAEFTFMTTSGMKSVLHIPLHIGGKLIGTMATSSFAQYITWNPSRTSRFQEIGSIFANALARKHDDERLKAAYAQISTLKERLERENVYLREEIRLEHDHSTVIGQSEAIRSVLKKAEQVAVTDSAVLLLGETGTGKELIARTIHDLSKRKDRPMVKVNCAAMPASLIENELFGREKGAYTGALSREIGRFELADRSTILLDEIGEMPLELQSKLLRVLQDGEFERLGSSRTLRVDVRVIAATNRDLVAAVKEGKFREDLYYRLSVFPIQIPPLRERREDIPALTWHILRNQCNKMGRDIESIQPATLSAFNGYSWPGNIRELGNVIERYLIINPGPVFRAEVPKLDVAVESEGQNLDDVERRHMLQVLQKTRWRIRGKGGAAESLGLKATTLEARMKKLGINRPGSSETE